MGKSIYMSLFTFPSISGLRTFTMVDTEGHYNNEANKDILSLPFSLSSGGTTHIFPLHPF